MPDKAEKPGKSPYLPVRVPRAKQAEYVEAATRAGKTLSAWTREALEAAVSGTVAGEPLPRDAAFLEAVRFAQSYCHQPGPAAAVRTAILEYFELVTVAGVHPQSVIAEAKAQRAGRRSPRARRGGTR